jgi:hypothetical protein
VPLLETDCVAQSGHRFIEIVVFDGARGHQRGERLCDDVELLPGGLGAAAAGVSSSATSNCVRTLATV